MTKKYFYINNKNVRIPSILWGEPGQKLLIEVHGNFSHKEDAVISLMADIAVKRGYQVLSFDLPKHGERSNTDYELTPQNCISDLKKIFEYAKSLASDISLFACSLGAYFSLLAYHDLEIEQTLFLSPVVNMERLINNMMTGFQITEERLRTEKKIELPIGETLDWDYYTYVKKNPIDFKWSSPISILYGSKDEVTEWQELSSFLSRYRAEAEILEDGEHFFHIEAQLETFKAWTAKELF